MELPEALRIERILTSDYPVGVALLNNGSIYIFGEKAGVQIDPTSGAIISKAWKGEGDVVDWGSMKNITPMSDRMAELVSEIVYRYGHQQAQNVAPDDLGYLRNLLGL
jgi:hypothetical protein